MQCVRLYQGCAFLNLIDYSIVLNRNYRATSSRLGRVVRSHEHDRLACKPVSTFDSCIQTFAKGNATQETTRKSITCAVRIDNLAAIHLFHFVHVDLHVTRCLSLRDNGGLRTLRDDHDPLTLVILLWQCRNVLCNSSNICLLESQSNIVV